MVEILPHTERFILIFNRLKNEKKLPSNSALAAKLGMGSGNTLTEIKSGRQNISIESIQKFCDLYGKANGFSMEDFIGKIGDTFNPDDEANWERAKIINLEQEVADLKSLVYKLLGRNRSYDECLDDIENGSKRILNDLRRSNKGRG
ncbi:hypothetical protein [Chitinophaga tropicalis]|uniref:HTH cro/C1-type domain-containing protein n=1 Tax=Chitinophaga tropicalis TaxID=2683588 RepID=A0A7K1UAN4_9BACT|nr:hypothetical protein [Chitinophaga tropicalis]MVT11338.1 hypothetical protein [Chitinophaga tropicalis]